MTQPSRSTAIEPGHKGAGNKALIGILLAGTIGVIIFLFVHLSSNANSPTLTIGSKPAAASCAKGEHCLPDVSYIDTNGVAYSKASLAGKVVIINFWATWCKPCLKEIPDLSKISEAYKNKGVVVLGILSSDNPDNATLLNFQSDNNMTFPVVRATSDILVSYDYPGSLPTTFIFDRNGRQVANHVGALSEQKLNDILAPLTSK
jgi:thiol-disulfide isomerase/thioredoxin